MLVAANTPHLGRLVDMPKHGDHKHGHKHKDDVEEPLLLQRTGATVSNQANATLNYRLLHNPKFRALLVQSVRVLDAR